MPLPDEPEPPDDPPRPEEPAILDGAGVVNFGVPLEEVGGGLSTKEVSVVLEKSMSLSHSSE